MKSTEEPPAPAEPPPKVTGQTIEGEVRQERSTKV
jgi:hypothetical protein